MRHVAIGLPNRIATCRIATETTASSTLQKAKYRKPFTIHR
ncbi:MAG: hypothetical protein K0S81_2707, partial [Rhodospirillales bacterium]|nr:hypothetical protein [Rhodospirillales bacterium]